MDGAAPVPRISLVERSLHREILEWQPRHLELAKVAREAFGLDAVEYGSEFFRDKATDFAYLAEMRKRAQDQGVASVLVKVSDAGPLGSAEAPERYTAIEAHFPWVVAAAFLGCESVSVAAEGFGSGAPYLEWTADSLQRLGTLAGAYGIQVLVGNRTGLACDGSWMAALMKRTAHPKVGTHPHFDNFDLGGGKTYPRYQGVQEMLPWAKALAARGEEPRVDFARMAKLAIDAGYSGWVGIEFDGTDVPEREGVARTIALVRRAWAG